MPDLIRLTRAVRFCVSLTPGRTLPAGQNTYAARPTVDGLVAFYEVDVACHGRPDPETGFFVNIAVIDRVVREHLVPRVQAAVWNDASIDPESLLPELLASIQPDLRDSVVSLAWRLTPYHALVIETERPNRVLVREVFEFAASHRLHCPGRDDAANREIYGKCSNLNGHGHNYRVEVTVAKPLGRDAAPKFSPAALEDAVDRHVIERFDHKHLNLDTAEFATLNSSVENIAKVCYDLLREPVAELGVDLATVTVWETGKTSCTYPAT